MTFRLANTTLTTVRMGCWDVGGSGCGICEMWNVRDVECSECGVFGMWDVGCRMFAGIWDVGLQNALSKNMISVASFIKAARKFC